MDVIAMNKAIEFLEERINRLEQFSIELHERIVAFETELGDRHV